PRLVTELVASFQITGLFKLEWTLGWRVAIWNKTNELKAAAEEITGIHTKIDLVKTEVTAATSTSIDTAKTEITAATTTAVDNLKTEVNKTFTKISAISTDISNAKLLTAQAILLG
ncbi:MAG: hypothetical protein R3B70_48910, partial [Polyangiaceae bacterium]